MARGLEAERADFKVKRYKSMRWEESLARSLPVLYNCSFDRGIIEQLKNLIRFVDI